MSRTALVTGGAGFIGSHLADRLIAMGYRVVVLDDESTGLKGNVSREALYIEGNVAIEEDLRRSFEVGVDLVCHVAGQASTMRSFETPELDLRTNVMGTLNVLNCCLRYKVPRLLYASSMTVYGHPEALPVSEDQPCRPISYYGITKQAAERYVHATAQRKDLGFEFSATSFRMFNVYGERQSLENPYQGVMAIFMGNILRCEPIRIYGDGEQSRDFVHIQDVVDAWVSTIDNEKARNEVFNLGSGARRSVNQLVDAVLGAFGRSRTDFPVLYEEGRPGDQRHMEADISKAERLLGWKPLISFQEGMTRTATWAARFTKGDI